MENMPPAPVGPPPHNSFQPVQPVQQPWAQTGPMSGPIHHPWAASPYASAVPLFHVPGRVRGRLSNYREGWLCMVPEGLLLSGKAMPDAKPGNVFARIGIFFLFGSLFGTMIAENTLQRPRHDALPWNCVEEIVLNTRKGRLCLVYHLPNAPNQPLSLGLRLGPPPLFQQFVHIATHYLGEGTVHEGKIGPPTPPAQAFLALGILCALLFGIFMLLASTGKV